MPASAESAWPRSYEHEGDYKVGGRLTTKSALLQQPALKLILLFLLTVLGIAAREAAQDCTVFTSVTQTNRGRVSCELDRRPAPPDYCQVTSRVLAGLPVNTLPTPIRTATILQHALQRTPSVSTAVEA